MVALAVNDARVTLWRGIKFAPELLLRLPDGLVSDEGAHPKRQRSHCQSQARPRWSLAHQGQRAFPNLGETLSPRWVRRPCALEYKCSDSYPWVGPSQIPFLQTKPCSFPTRRRPQPGLRRCRDE